MDIICKCIDNYPQARPHASEIVERLAMMVLQFPTSFANRLEMLRRIEADTREKIALIEEGKRKDRVLNSSKGMPNLNTQRRSSSQRGTKICRSRSIKASPF